VCRLSYYEKVSKALAVFDRADVYCKAEFPCEFKRLKRVKNRKTQKRQRRYYVICVWEGTCNQQTLTPIIKLKER